MIRTSHRRELQFARSAVATTAHAYGLHAIDLVCIEYSNMGVLEEECCEGREMGFTGKQAIHPKQIPIIHTRFSPSEKGTILFTYVFVSPKWHNLVAGIMDNLFL